MAYKFGLMSGHCGSLTCQKDGWKQYTFDDGVTVYEGIKNRHIKLKTIELGNALGLDVIDVNKETKDYTLQERVDMINDCVDMYGSDFMLFEIHNNASPNHNASGFEVYSTRLKNRSDEVAEVVLNQLAITFPEIPNRGHKETDYFIIKNMRAFGVLIEFCFFDYRPDVDLVLSPAGISKCAQVLVNSMKQLNKQII